MRKACEGSLATMMALLLLLVAGHWDARASGSFSPTAAMNKTRYMNTTTLLNDGRVLVAGGRGQSVFPYGQAELFDPGSGSFAYTGTMIEPRTEHRANRLPDGRVLITGGRTFNAISGQAELFDPASGTFVPTGAMTTARADFTATSLADGRVLLAGGLQPFSLLASAEIYNPATGTFTATGSMAGVRFNHVASLLADGRVLVAGGKSGTSDILSTASIYDPATGTFSATGSMGEARVHFTATRLQDGRVLVTGGSLDSSINIKATAELYDPATGTFSPTGAMSVARDYHTATLLADGRVLVAGGGLLGGQGSTTAELYDPATGTFSTTGTMGVWRSVFGASLLADGRVLLAGGQLFAEPSAEIYTLDPQPVEVPEPVLGKSVSVEPVQGTVTTKCQGDSRFTPLTAAESIPVGCQINAVKGRVELTSARNRNGETQSAEFYQGTFKVTQKKGSNPTTDITLTGPTGCGNQKDRASTSAALPSAQTSRSSLRRLWGKGKGSFKTRGNRGSGTVRGTTWLVEDRCDGSTLFAVKTGVVKVRDFGKKKPITLKKAQRYVAKAASRRR